MIGKILDEIQKMHFKFNKIDKRFDKIDNKIKSKSLMKKMN